MMSKNKYSNWPTWALCSLLTFILLNVAAYITHWVLLFKDIMGETEMTINLVLLYVLGAFISPIGMIHGWGNWFGVW